MSKDKLKAGDGEQGTGSDAGALATALAESGLPGEGAAVATEAGGVVDAPGDGADDLTTPEAGAEASPEIPEPHTATGEASNSVDAELDGGAVEASGGLYQTSDGETFEMEYHARSHARSLKDHTVTRVKRTA